MANPLNNVAVPDQYDDKNCAILNIFGGRGGSFNVRSQPIFYELQYGTFGDTHLGEETALQPGSGTIEAGAIGVRFRNQIAGKAATVDAYIAPPGRPLLSLNSAGTVSATSITGIVAANGTITAGTGFTVNRTGVGVYVITFSTSFSATPVVLVDITTDTLIEHSLSATSASAVTVKTYNGSTYVAVDQAFNFVAQAIV